MAEVATGEQTYVERFEAASAEIQAAYQEASFSDLVSAVKRGELDTLVALAEENWLRNRYLRYT